VQKSPHKPPPEDNEPPMGCASRAALLFISAAVFIMGVCTVVFPSTHHNHTRKGNILTDLVIDFLFMTRAGGVVLFVIAICILLVALRRK
jgi:hypothetical protein